MLWKNVAYGCQVVIACTEELAAARIRGCGQKGKLGRVDLLTSRTDPADILNRCGRCLAVTAQEARPVMQVRHLPFTRGTKVELSPSHVIVEHAGVRTACWWSITNVICTIISWVICVQVVAPAWIDASHPL